MFKTVINQPTIVKAQGNGSPRPPATGNCSTIELYSCYVTDAKALKTAFNGHTLMLHLKGQHLVLAMKNSVDILNFNSPL